VAVLDAVLSLTEADSADEAVAGILRTLARAAPADAFSVLRADDDGALSVVAQMGLSAAVKDVRFRAADHPRLARASEGAAPVRFTDPREADPFDGLLLGSTAAVDPIHACLAAPLYLQKRLVGILTMDALAPHGLDGIGDDEVRVFAGLLSAASLLAAPRPVARRAPAGPRALLGDSPAMGRIEREISILAPLATTVLVTGESGVGKELVAQALHARSGRAARPLVTVNCAALPGEIVLSELFGHTRGAFTGAAATRHGRFEAANGGTLFLDEIGDLPLSAQGPLLRALQEGEIQRVGEDRARHVDVRIVAATHRDLAREVREGRFREDLLHRLWVYPIAVPPLRERPEDIALLAMHFAGKLAARLGVPEIGFDDEILAEMRRRPWPGNVRQLEHAVERATLRRIVAQGAPRKAMTLRRQDLDAGAGGAADIDAPCNAPARSLDQTLDEARRNAFEGAFRASSGNAAKAARLLGLSRSFAYKEGIRLGLLPPTKR
jgi:anaerobic nitric oxide reductase transcription regulator